MTDNLTTNINLFQPTGFRVVVDRKNFSNLVFFVQSVTHPSVTNAPPDVPVSRVTSVSMPGNKIDYGELTMSVLLDEDLNSYTEMYDWMLRLVNEPQIAKRDTFGGSGTNTTTPTFADISVSALNSANVPNKTFTYYDCIPVSLGDIQFEAQNQGVEFFAFPVSFRFTHFEIA